MDSTPILPTPAAFVTFVRAFLDAKGMKRLLRVFPYKAHRCLVWVRWVLGAAYARLKHAVLRRDNSKDVGPSAGIWLNKFSNGVFLRKYPTLIDTTLDVVFRGGQDVRFLYNPQDPFISQDDLKLAISSVGIFGDFCSRPIWVLRVRALSSS